MKGEEMTEIREFETGATRDTDETKFDYEAFLSPLVLERYAEYMHKYRKQPDGSVRDGDNWQKGIPEDAYMKSLWRHFMDVWKEHRGIKTKAGMAEALCAVMFNAMGMLHEQLRDKQIEQFEKEMEAPAPPPNPVTTNLLSQLFRRN